MKAAMSKEIESALPTELAHWFDTDGFFAEPSRWSPDKAIRIAEEFGIRTLTPLHWTIIHHVRERFYRLGALPVMRLVCRAAGVERAKAHKLFGSCRTLWRVAGLPNPGEEAKSYMA